MIKRKVRITAMVIISFLLVASAAFASSAISSSHWAVDYADFCINNRYFLETTKRSAFNAEANYTRQEVPLALGMIQDADNLYFTQIETGFTDVYVGHPYAGAIKWGVNNGIVSGVGGNSFNPSGNVTREQLCVFINRYCNRFGITLTQTPDTPTFTDASSISQYARDAVNKMARAQIIDGFNDGSFRPQGNVTKAQAAAIMTRVYCQKNNSSSKINLYVKDVDGNDITNAASFFYTENPSAMDWTPAYSSLGIVSTPNSVAGMFGVNVVCVNTMASIPEYVYPRKNFYFVTVPRNKYDNIPVPGYTPGSKWPHVSDCKDLWAYNNNFTYCGTEYLKSYQNFGWRYMNGVREFHQGIDISGGGKSAKSIAGQDATVKNTGFDYSMGNYVQLKLTNESKYITYMHLSSISVLNSATVSHGQEVGITGNSGYSTGPHLHLQISSKESPLGAGTTAETRSNYVDPRTYID